MTVLNISQQTLIQLPDGANGGAVRISYNGTTVGNVIASGADQGQAVITTGRLAKLTAIDGKSPLQVVGRESGGRYPAPVTIRIYPTYPPNTLGPSEPITLTGLPVGSPDLPGIWDLSNVEDSSGGMDIITAAERSTFAEIKGAAVTAVQQAQEALAGSAAMQQANQIALQEAIADIRATAPGTALPVLARPVATDTFTLAQNWTSGSADSQRGYQVQAGTATVNAVTGQLTVAANVTGGGAPGMVTPWHLYEGTMRVLVQSADQNAVVMWGGGESATGKHFAVWKAGGNLEVGWWNLNADKAVDSVTSVANTPAPGSDYWIEVMLTLRAAVVRVWNASADRSSATVLVIGFDNEQPPVTLGGLLRLASIGDNPAVYGAIVVDSYDRQPNPLSQKAALIGPWFSVVEGQQNAMATITSGSELRSRVNGTPGVGINLLIPEGMSFRPVIAWRIREVGTVSWSAWTRFSVPSNNAPGDLIRVDPVTGLSAAKTYDVQMCFNVQESDPLWRRRAGVIVQDVLIGSGGSITALQEPQRIRIEGVGDSITAGIVALGHSTVSNTPASTTAVLASEWSYLHVCCDLLGAIPLQNGYGGTGVTVTGEGGIPTAIDNTSKTMINRPGKDFFPGPPHVLILNHGTNDDGAQYRNPPAKPDSATFSAAYRQLCLSLLAKNPAAMLICMRPFNGGFWPEIQAVAGALGLPTIDTTGWLDAAKGDYADNDYTHPLGFPEGIDRGHRKAGRLLAQALTALGVPVITL